MPYPKQPWHNNDGMGTLLLAMVLMFAVIIGLTVLCARPVQSEDGKVVVTVRDFGKGMTPVMPPYVNDPEAIVLSQNMYSTQPGSRQLRFGISEILDYDSVAAKTTAPIDALLAFFPVEDSSALILAAGGKWYSEYSGEGWSGDKFRMWYDTFTNVREIHPYSIGTIKRYATADTVVGAGTRFVRDVQPGDSIFMADTARQVLSVISDTRLRVTAAYANTLGSTAFTLSRTYPDSSNANPYLIQSGDMVYTGNSHSYPQVIYSRDDTLYIRSAGVVDSFRIDDISTILNETEWRTYDSIPVSFKKYTHNIALVSRHANWVPGQWFDDAYDGVQTYYVTLGHDIPNGSGYKYNTRHYTIDGNTDTSIFLRAWYVDSLIAGAGTQSWSDSIFHDSVRQFTPLLRDTLPDAVVTGTWGYIRCAVGNVRTVLADDSTPSATLMGRGAVWALTGSDAAIISPDSFYNGLYYLHLTGSDVEWPSVSSVPGWPYYASRLYTYLQKWYTNHGTVPEPALWEPPAGDSILSVTEWRSTIVHGTHVDYRDRTYSVLAGANRLAAGYPSVVNGWYPVRYAVLDTVGTDSLWIVTAVSDGLNDITTQTTANWELVRVGMPYWAGLAEYNYQLVGWGDANSGATVSFSSSGKPWDWPIANDVSIGSDPSDPLRGVLAYNDELVFFKAHSMIGWPGARELSLSDGLVGQRAVVGLNKFLYWLDVDGVKRMARRDFSGYSVEKISADLDPVFNSWNYLQFGTDVAPFTINPQYRYKSVLTHNQRDNHLYLFFPEGGSTKNNRCLTYNIQTGKWDGYFTLSASDAIWATVRDTSRIIMGSPDSALVTGLDYAYNDLGKAIPMDLKGARFYIPDADGVPVDSKLNWARFRVRGLTTGASDTIRVIFWGEDLGGSNKQIDTLGIGGLSTLAIYNQIYRPTTDRISLWWQWEITHTGPDSVFNILQPIELQMEFTPVRRGD